MTLRFFEGPAGSGKTTRVVQELARALQAYPLGEQQKVLALTKMHGSRRRMQDRLTSLPGLRGRLECTTIDSLAWRLIRRWRTLAHSKDITDLAEDDYEQVCESAGSLLAEPIVERWATRAFPFVVIDELQDSKGGQLAIVRSLSASATCIAAADDYQDLEAIGTNDAIAWAREFGDVVSLTDNHRTSAEGLLAAARALRGGRALPREGSGFKVLGALNKNVGASYVSRNLTWWRECSDIAIVTPVRVASSTFVRDLLARVQEKPIGKPATGPHRIPWEVSQEDDFQQFVAGLGLPSDTSAEVRASDVCLSKAGGLSSDLLAWVDQQRCVAGRMKFITKEILQQARRVHQRSRAYRRVRDGGVRAMTIHQSKNREFDSVIVLWPYEVAGSADRQRRLLYNAITRAQRQAVVIVQNPKRLDNPPFAGEG